MKGIEVRIKDGHVMDGEGECLGTDLEGNTHTFWRASGTMEIPLDLAIDLEKERPQRFEIIDRKLAAKIRGTDEEEEPTEPVDETEITLKTLKDMVKDDLNDWAAKRDYDVNPSKQKKSKMVTELVKQIEARTGKKVK